MKQLVEFLINKPIYHKNVKYAIDLGLPSGTLWRDRNLNANSPEEIGEYYAFGEVKEKQTYEDYNYKPVCKDTANYILGDNWYIPNKKQIDELIDNTIAIFHGSYLELKSKINDNVLVFPYSRKKGSVFHANAPTLLWGYDEDYEGIPPVLYINDENKLITGNRTLPVFRGLNIRPVLNE